MKRLSLHILSLLRLYDSVVLPGTGIFHISYFPASFNSETYSFMPSRFEISFTKQNERDVNDLQFEILSGDNHILDSYIRKEKVSPEEASQILQQDLLKFRDFINRGGNPILPELGLINSPLPVINLSDPSRVLDTEDTTEVKEYIIPIEEENIQNSEANKEISDISKACKTGEYPRAEKELDVRRQDRWRNPDYYYIPVHKKGANIAACILLVAIVGISTFIPGRHSSSSKSAASIVPMTITEKVVEKENNISSQISSEQSQTKKENTYTTPSSEPVPGATSLPSTPFVTEGSTNMKYFAIDSAFKSEKEAEKFIHSHNGIKANFQVIKNSRNYMVAAAASQTKEELESNMPLVRADFPDAWIFTLH